MIRQIFLAMRTQVSCHPVLLPGKSRGAAQSKSKISFSLLPCDWLWSILSA